MKYDVLLLWGRVTTYDSIAMNDSSSGLVLGKCIHTAGTAEQTCDGTGHHQCVPKGSHDAV
jgi:hypothetical protein